MNKKLYIGYDENIEDFRIGTWEEINSYDSITLKDTLEDFEISEIIEFIKDLEEINLTIEKLAGGERKVKLEVEDWITEITTKETINKLENKLIESFGDMIKIK